ncbi:MAG: nitroreductase family protein [bacterium]
MELKEVLQYRRSVRKFLPRTVNDALLEEILRTAQRAPSAGNLQAYRVKIVRGDEEKNALREATMRRQESLTSAPVVLVICAKGAESAEKYGERGATLYAVQDATLYAAYVQLALTDRGLSSVWVGAFSEEDVRTALSLPPALRPIIMLPLGYAAEAPSERERKDIQDIIV